jgi:hypothetical protein
MAFPAGSIRIGSIGATVSNAGTAAVSFDTLDYDYADVIVYMSSTDAASNNPSVFKFTHGTTTVASNGTTIDSLEGDGSDGWTVPPMYTQDADGHNVFKFGVDMRGKERHLGLIISPLTTHTVFSLCNLYRGPQVPDSSTDAQTIAFVEGA